MLDARGARRGRGTAIRIYLDLPSCLRVDYPDVYLSRRQCRRHDIAAFELQLYCEYVQRTSC